jgi:hypothetical protein
VSTAANNYGNSYNNGFGVNGLSGLNGLNGLSSLNQGGGISSILGRVMNGF